MFKWMALLFYFVFSSASYAELIYEVSGTTGTMKDEVNSETYNEIELGALYHVSPFFALRGSVFNRFTDTSYSGANLSTRFLFSQKFGEFQFYSFAGPGYRLMSRGLHAPLAEGGIGVYYPGVQFSLGFRMIMNEAVDNGFKNDGQFFLGFNGVIGSSK